MVAIGSESAILRIETNEMINTHASFVQTAIDVMFKKINMSIHEIDAVVVTMGPGSYTGLRVGLSSAKGIAYAMNKPLIGISTLALLAKHAITHIKLIETEKNIQIFSMIDAKRMEVFGAVYNADLSIILPEQAFVLDSDFMANMLKKGPVLCVGNGAIKTNQLFSNNQLHCFESQYDIQDFMQLAIEKWIKKEFENTAYSSPSYLKEFYQGPAKSSK